MYRANDLLTGSADRECYRGNQVEELRSFPSLLPLFRGPRKVAIPQLQKRLGFWVLGQGQFWPEAARYHVCN
jgi:hypothetical protein